MFRRFVAVLALAAVTSAHFTLDYPKSRGFNEDIESQFCGGYKNVTARSPFPLNDGGFLTLTSEHDTATITVIISFKQSPTNFTDFTKNNSGGDQAPLQNFFQVTGQSSYCIPVNIGALKYPGASDGTNATIQVQYNGGDGDLFQCTDVTLSSSATVPSGTKCTNPVGSLANQATGTSSTGAPKPSGAAASFLQTGVTGVVLAGIGSVLALAL